MQVKTMGNSMETKPKGKTEKEKCLFQVCNKNKAKTKRKQEKGRKSRIDQVVRNLKMNKLWNL